MPSAILDVIGIEAICADPVGGPVLTAKTGDNMGLPSKNGKTDKSKNIPWYRLFTHTQHDLNIKQVCLI